VDELKIRKFYPYIPAFTLTVQSAANLAAQMTARYWEVKQRATSSALVGIVFIDPTAALR
jgi:uncharacterized protein affecting Mg2+/Co2+ transport